jgi:hypothetical protein
MVRAGALGRASSPDTVLLGIFLAIHVAVIARLAAAGLLTAMLTAMLTAWLAAGLLTAAAFAMTLTLLARLIPLPSLVLSRTLLALGLIGGLLRGFRLSRAVRHIDSPGIVETAPTVGPAAAARM